MVGPLGRQHVQLLPGVLTQERAEQVTKQLQNVFGTLQRGVADGLAVLGSIRHGSGG